MSKDFRSNKTEVEFRVAFNIEANGVCPEEMVELNGLVGLLVVELTDADCNIENQWNVSRGNS